MKSDKDLPPVSRTAFYCCGIRELDAASPYPLLNDVYARTFMNDAGRALFNTYRPGYFARALNFTRPRLIENQIEDLLAGNSKRQIIQLGAGFDSRPYRLSGGDWLELDEHAIIDYKESRLPAADCPNRLKRLGIDWSKDSLAGILKEHVYDKKPLFVVEGVFMYLEEDEIRHTLSALAQYDHTLLCDLMTSLFVHGYGRRARRPFHEMGAVIKCKDNHPERIFLEAGYHIERELSVYKAALAYGAVKMPGIVPPGLKKGYRVMLFEK